MEDVITVSAESDGLNQVERVVDVFVAPTATFRDILRSTSWWLPFVLMVLTSIGVTAAVQQKVGWDQVVQTQMQMTPSMQERMASLTPDEQATQLHRMALGYQYSFYASPVLVLLFTAIAALVLWATFNFGLGAHTTYSQMFCLWMYCSLPRLITGLITVLMLYFGSSPESYNMKEPVGTNIAYYIPDAAPWLRALLGFFDVIGIWVLILLIVGSAIVAKVSVGKAAAAIIGWWLLMLLASVAAAAAFS